MNAASYARLSRYREESTSIERQQTAVRQAAEARGATVTIEEADVDISGQRYDRPGLHRILDALPQLDMVVVWKLDRLARSVRDLATIVDTLQKHNVALVSATEPFDMSTPFGRAVVQLLGVFAELEAQMIAERVKAANATLRSVGRARGGNEPYGYVKVPNPNGAGYVVDIEPERGEVMRDVLRRVLDGESIHSICRSNADAGIPGPGRNGNWYPWTLAQLLRNPRLLGYSMYDGKPIRGDDGMPMKDRPPLLDRKAFDKLQRIMSAKMQPGGSGRAEGLLTGVLRCAECDSLMYLSTGKTGPFYVCHTRARRGKQHCPGCSAKRDLIEQHVEAQFLARFGTVRMATSEYTPRQDAEIADALHEVQSAMADLEADRYERRLFEGAAGATRFAELYGKLQTRESELMAALGEDDDTGDVVSSAITIGEEWQAADIAGRRELLRAAYVLLPLRKGQRGRHGFDASRLPMDVPTGHLLRLAKVGY